MTDDAPSPCDFLFLELLGIPTGGVLIIAQRGGESTLTHNI
jgi:hypothetical protein